MKKRGNGPSFIRKEITSYRIGTLAMPYNYSLPFLSLGRLGSEINFRKLVIFHFQQKNTIVRLKENFLSPEPGERGFTYQQVVPAFGDAKQVMTSNIIKCSFIPFPGLQIKRGNCKYIPAFVSNVWFHVLSSKIMRFGTYGNQFVHMSYKRMILDIEN